MCISADPYMHQEQSFSMACKLTAIEDCEQPELSQGRIHPSAERPKIGNPVGR